MFNQPLALEFAHSSVEEAMRLGASFADARYELRQHESLVVQNGRLHRAAAGVDRGIGVRALVRGAWGFSAVSEPTRHDTIVAARRAVELAKAASILLSERAALIEEEPRHAIYRTPIKRDPLAVPIEDKVSLLFQIDAKLRNSELITFSNVGFSAQRLRKLYVSSEGSEIDQELTHTGMGFQVGASNGRDFQVRSYPGSGGLQFMGMGWEMVSELSILEKAEITRDEAVQQLTADACPHMTTTLILGSSQLARQVHGSCGQALELDRMLGHERGGAGASFVGADRLGNFDFGSRVLGLVADARQTGAPGTFGFDDEGVEAQRVELVTEGRLTGYLSGRETAQRVGFERSSGAMRAAGWATSPLVRMTNVSLAPGDGDLDRLIGDTKSGVFMDCCRGLSIDEFGGEFQAACEVAWEIKDGKKTRPLKNPAYRGVTTEFWKALNAVCGASESTMYGVAGARKSLPGQFVIVGHGTAPARFSKIELGFAGEHEPPFDRDPTPHVAYPAAENVVDSKRSFRSGSKKRAGGKKSRKRDRS